MWTNGSAIPRLAATRAEADARPVLNAVPTSETDTEAESCPVEVESLVDVVRVDVVPSEVALLDLPQVDLRLVDMLLVDARLGMYG